MSSNYFVTIPDRTGDGAETYTFEPDELDAALAVFFGAIHRDGAEAAELKWSA